MADGILGFIKSIPLRTWIIGAFVILFLIWFIPKAGMFTKIAGALGIAAALGFLAPVLFPLLAALGGGVAAALAAAVAAFKKAKEEGQSDDDSKDVADGAKTEVESTMEHVNNDPSVTEEQAAAGGKAGLDEAKEAADDDTPSEDVGRNTSEAITNEVYE